MDEWRLRKNLFESNLEKLLAPKPQHQQQLGHTNDHRSPYLRHLQQNGSNQRVKQLSQVFEKKSSTFNLKTNWWLDESIGSSSKCENNNQENDDGWPAALPNSNIAAAWMRPRLSLSRSLNDLVSMKNEKATRNISKIVDELLQKELTYMQSLERGIELYVKAIAEGGSGVPKQLRHQTFNVFGNIKEIYRLHADSVYPRLSICGGSEQLIAETLSNFIVNDYFYCYIVYAINQKSAEQIIAANQRYFEKLSIKHKDYLGINSFIILPVQKLPRYKLFLDAIIAEISKSPYAAIVDKDALAACREAEQHVSKLLLRLNEALLINDIVETHDIPAAVQLVYITSVKEQIGFKSGDEPLLFIVPRERSSSDYDFKSLVSCHEIGI